MKKIKIVTLIIIIFLSANLVQANNKDVTISNVDLANGCLTTIDVHITENIAKQEDLIIDYDYGKIRKEE